MQVFRKLHCFFGKFIGIMQLLHQWLNIIYFKSNIFDILTKFYVLGTSHEPAGFLRCSFFWYLKGSSVRNEQKSPVELKKTNLKKSFSLEKEGWLLRLAFLLAMLVRAPSA